MPVRLTFFRIIVALSVVATGREAAAQKAAAYETVSTAQGLSQGMVFDLLQDREGFLWVATKNGLNRYDGYAFKVFSNDPYNPHTLSSNTVVKLFEDTKGRIWVGTEDAGLNVYDKRSGNFYRIAHQASDPGSLSGNAIRWIEELPDGRMLVASDGAGLNVIQLADDFFTNTPAPVITRLSLPTGAQVYGMGRDKIGRTWIGGMDGSIYQYNPLRNSFAALSGGQLYNNGFLTQDSSILINHNLFLFDGRDVYALFDTTKMPAGNIVFRPRQKLWENHHRELHFYDVSKREPGKDLQWNLQLPERIRIVYPFITDRSGLLWSGSVGYGLRKYNTTGNRFKTRLPGYSVRWIVPVAAGDFFVGDFAYGWRRLKGDSVQNDPFATVSSLTEIDNVLVTRKGDCWIKSDNKGYFHYNAATRKLAGYPAINAYQGIGDKQPMLEDSEGNLWFPGLGGHISRLHPASGKIDSFTINTSAAKPLLPKAICTALFEDEQGTFWIGTQEGFARVVFGKTAAAPTVTWYDNNSSNRNSLNYNHVSCFLDDPAEPAKYLWICTKGGGLNRLTKATGDFLHLTTKDGLPHNVVYGVLADDDGNLWGSTNNGIFCLLAGAENGRRAVRNFTKANGLQDDEFNTGAYAKLPGGELVFGGVNGLNRFRPKEVLSAAFTPGVFVTNILVNNLPVQPGDKTGILQQTIEATAAITLGYLQDILTLEFSSLDFTAPAQNRYRYQLVGVDKDWVESSTRRTATYLHLPSGRYVFKVQGSNSQGVWSNRTSELQITVLPPWWRTGWAYAVYLLLFGLAVRTYFRFSVNRARLRAQLDFEHREARRMKELDSLKTQLYTNITHEFRTPLTVILGMAQQVMDKPDQNFSAGLNIILRNGQSLLNLVNEMLDLSKLETGKMLLQPVKGDILNFLRYIVESFHSLAESSQKGLHFLTDIEALPVAYDPEKMRQIVSNLLANALKFTPAKGNVYFSVTVTAEQPDNPKVTLILKVKDTGIGIPEDQQQHIFDRFYQLDNSHTRKAEGTGIGLALTKELVKLMGGEISVKSPPASAGKGTEFTVALPFERLPFATDNGVPLVIHERPPSPMAVKLPVPGPVKNEQKNVAKPLILLVEDNADVVAYTASCLPDYRLAVGKDGQEGFAIATEMIPDLVITDVMMPYVDGFELCSRLRGSELTSHIPVIMLTAKADMESKIEGLQTGADAYLQKPFHKEELLVQIKKLLELRQHLQQYYQKKSGLSTEAPPSPVKAAPAVAQLNVEDAFVKKVREAIDAHLEDAGFNVEQLCKLLFISHSQLHRKLEALTGFSPNRFIRVVRFRRARELLKVPSTTIASVAYDCGFTDPGYFARVFKQEFGLTPQEWRASNKMVT